MPYRAGVLLTSLSVPVVEFETATGWRLERRGACKGEVCVPLPPGAVVGETVRVDVVAGRLGMPLVRDEQAGLWALGPESQVTGRALTTAVAPELRLPDVRTGEEFALSSLRGRKVVLVAWASW